MTHPLPIKLVAIAGLSLTSSTLLIGCSDSTDPISSEAPQSQADTHAGHDHAADEHTTVTPDVYTDILGEITELPVEGDPNSALKIHHAQIPDFKTKDGTINITATGIAGMRSMTMPFPPAEGLSLDGLSVDDKIKFTFQVNWGGTTGAAWEVTKIEKIDPETVIDFSNKVEDIKDDATEAIEDTMDNMTDHADHDHDAP